MSYNDPFEQAAFIVEAGKCQWEPFVYETHIPEPELQLARRKSGCSARGLASVPVAVCERS